MLLNVFVPGRSWLGADTANANVVRLVTEPFCEVVDCSDLPPTPPNPGCWSHVKYVYGYRAGSFAWSDFVFGADNQLECNDNGRPPPDRLYAHVGIVGDPNSGATPAHNSSTQNNTRELRSGFAESVADADNNNGNPCMTATGSGQAQYLYKGPGSYAPENYDATQNAYKMCYKDRPSQ